MKMKGLYYKLHFYQMLVDEPEYQQVEAEESKEIEIATLELS